MAVKFVLEINRKNKTSGFNSNKAVKDKKPIDINLSLNTLDIMCQMVVSTNKTIRRTQLNNLRSLISIIDPNMYINDAEKSKRISFIRKGIEARVEFNLTDPYMILSHINGGIIDGDIVDLDNHKEISSAEINWLNNMISETLKYAHIYDYVDTVMDICTKFVTAEAGSKAESVKEFEGVISSIQNGLRKRKNESLSEASFSLRDGDFENSIYETYNELASPKRKLKTGMQGLNEMLGGGFEATRCYVFFGLPGEGKSTVLLNLAYQIKKYNKDYETKDPTKRPCIVLLTMENMVGESIERIFSVSTGKDKMIDYKPEDIIKMMREDGELRLNDDSPIDIIIKFKPSNSVDTSYLYTLAEDLEDEGYELICIIQDYIGRIRSTERYTESRLEYGAVSDEFKIFAEIKCIPVITASQLNRDASKHIDEAKQKSKADLVRLLGRSNISESMLILNNIDGGFMIAPEVTRDGERYLGVQDIKHRYNTSGLAFIYLPFFNGTNKLVEDFYGEPTYKLTMREDNSMNTNPTAPKLSPYHTNSATIMNNEFMLKSSEDSMFSAKVYSSNPEELIDNIAAFRRRQYFDPMLINNDGLFNPMVSCDADGLFDPMIRVG